MVHRVTQFNLKVGFQAYNQHWIHIRLLIFVFKLRIFFSIVVNKNFKNIFFQDPFFSSGLFPRSLPPSACSQTPSFSPEPYLNHHMDISNLTSSVHTLTLPNPNLSTHHNPMELRSIDVFKTPKPKVRLKLL